MTKRVLTPIADRFWPKVQKTDVCWLWIGATSAGYGRIGRGRAKDHEVSWELHNGPVPHGLWVLHKCDNPPCVRPDHLFLGTQSDNMKDAEAKGRLKHPGRAPRAKESIP